MLLGLVALELDDAGKDIVDGGGCCFSMILLFRLCWEINFPCKKRQIKLI